MTAMEMIDLAPVDWEKTVDSMSAFKRQDLASRCDSIAKYATMVGTYLESRYGYGCGDQGHEAAVVAANAAGKKVWVKALGYNEFVPIQV